MFVALRDLRFAKGRFALMGVVIVLITLLVGLLSGLTAGLGRQNVSAITDLPADHIVFGGPSYSDSTITEEQQRIWAATPGVLQAGPLGISTTKAASGSRSTAVTVFATPDAEENSVTLSAPAANELGAGAGDEITIAGKTLTVAQVRGDAYFSHTPVVWTRLTTPATVIVLRTENADVSATDAKAGTRTVTTTDSLQAIGSYRSENGSLQLMRGFLFVISALVIGAFFTVWTIQRSADIAVLKALGTSTATLLADALGQALILLVTGTAIGTALAAEIGTAVRDTVPFLLEPATVLTPAATTVLLGALGAALAVRRVVTVDPLTALGSVR
ncbi:ABC transporter substrate-binding protein [Lentzea aerocolonigenes]|uniref:ABC transporter substrate-binding protein n=1 Tax=Lentzea aerocolonigenes TaxID=68170 RepID=A0A0F0GLR8_LENAE|nr:FtsX-like permease family protein [Lentzea aerocolonigenes]KJK44275.1 ABC transporter substrate-binding protein [Lentzea aerocolonigenes]